MAESQKSSQILHRYYSRYELWAFPFPNALNGNGILGAVDRNNEVFGM